MEKCPRIDDMTRFRKGEMTEEEAEQFENHIMDGCEVCGPVYAAQQTILEAPNGLHEIVGQTAIMNAEKQTRIDARGDASAGDNPTPPGG